MARAQLDRCRYWGWNLLTALRNQVKIPLRNRVITFSVMIQSGCSWYFGLLISLVRATPLLHIQINLGRLLVVVILSRDQMKSFLTVLLRLNLFETGPDTSRNADYDAHFHNKASIDDELNHFLRAYKFIYTQTWHTSISYDLVVDELRLVFIRSSLNVQSLIINILSYPKELKQAYKPFVFFGLSKRKPY